MFSGVVIPANLKLSPGETSSALLHLTADNVDIQLDTLDGKKSFHGTQLVAFRRGARPLEEVLGSITRSRRKSVKIPDAIQALDKTIVKLNTIEPKLQTELKTEWYDTSEISESRRSAKVRDFTYFFNRQQSDDRQGWTAFNKTMSTNNAEITSCGYLPMILDPAHEFNTLNTVLRRAVSLADNLNQKYVILTGDQQVYCRLLELKWSNDDFQKRVILRMGGLHLSLNFLKAIGKHMSGSGLEELWVESGIAAETMASKVMEGKVYSKGMRLTKLTLQALWRIILPRFQQYLLEVNPDFAERLTGAAGDIICLEEIFEQNDILQYINEWVASTENVELQFWMTYVDMAHILLEFTRSLRDGQWDLYLSSLTQMLPYMARYDHHNYLKSLSVYIAEMNALPPEVESAFRRGDFVIKASPGDFNQVDPDHAQEWLVGEVKRASSGAIGLVQDQSSLQRWALTYCWHAAISSKTYEMYDLEKTTDLHAELYPGRKKRDQDDENSLMKAMEAFGMFNFEPDNTLKNVATKDVATDEIKTSLLTAKEQGALQVFQFINNRLGNQKSESLYARVKLNAAPTFQDLFKVDHSKHTAVKKSNKQDRNILQRLITAYEAGRAVDLKEILKHELHNVPLSLVHPNGIMRTGNKAELMKLMTENVEIPNTLPAGGSDHLIIDGQALIMSIGKPQHAQTFGDLANAVTSRIKNMSAHYQRVDIVFDRYNQLSIKAGTRQKRTASARPIRKAITSRAVPLPKSWSNYVALEENKAELAAFISNEIMSANFLDTTVVVAGGFADELKVAANTEMDCASLQSTHEEADTRLILHAVNSAHRRVVVSARDTDVFVLLVHHFKRMTCNECYMMAGTAKDRKYVPIHVVAASMSESERNNILIFHALTGCDSNSFIAGLCPFTFIVIITFSAVETHFSTHVLGIAKRGALAVYRLNYKLLDGITCGDVDESFLKQCEQFLVLLYKTKELTCDDARHMLFGKVTSPELLPATSDAARLHILRAVYQCVVWMSAHVAKPELPDPCQYGWRILDGNYAPVYSTLPVAPESCTQLLSCGCKSGCATKLCKCRREKEVCTKLCKCRGECTNQDNADGVFV
ncbi:uncharacterized protein LOC127750548 [Frankliniella occidentalis]|uniref:Uncharacterized protein LOC127750548 n=1 Tax=Frankliniella occidentalis TaxID=133901 RepID=A0A9C6X3F6_FRAOC|nr:uncharacterized protein LOC127750548 [Frankliniella occidentalis]